MELPLLVGINLVLVMVGGYLLYHHSQHQAHINQVLLTQKRKLTSMIASLSDGVIMLDENKSLVVANPAVERLLRVKAIYLEEVINILGSSCNLKDAIEQTFTAKLLVRLPQTELNGKSLQIDVDPVKDEVGNLLGIVIVIHDLTVASQLGRMHDDFTAMMIHELRTPLTTTLYSTTMMIEGFSGLQPTQVLSQLEIIKSTSVHLLSLVNDLLDVSKIEAGKFQIVKSSDNLQKLLNEKVATFMPLAAQKNLQLTLTVDPHLPPLSFDQNRISQVLDNLLSNSLKYTDQGTVEVRVFLEGPVIKVEVKDSGDGIRAEDLPKLFSKFEQLGKGKSGEKKGTGLGLVVAQGIITAHGGKIWAHSAGLGKGATCGFSLPLA